MLFSTSPSKVSREMLKKTRFFNIKSQIPQELALTFKKCLRHLLTKIMRHPNNFCTTLQSNRASKHTKNYQIVFATT
jgi:hypothetical protein